MQTKGFICLLIREEEVDLIPILRLIEHVDTALREFQQPSYHKPPIIHISIALFEPSSQFFVSNKDRIPMVSTSASDGNMLKTSDQKSDPKHNNSAITILSLLYPDSDNEDEPHAQQVSQNIEEAFNNVPEQDSISKVCTSIALTIGFQRIYEWTLSASSASSLSTIRRRYSMKDVD
jgi:hypothetical protein